MEQDDALSVLKLLVETDTTNPPGNELALAETIQKLLDGTSAESRLISCGTGRASLVSRIRGGGTARPMILCGHMDTVPFGDLGQWSVPPARLTRSGDLLYGRGTSDMKSGLAAMLCAFRAAARRSGVPKGDIYLALTADEESEGLGADSIADMLPLRDGVIFIAEPTDNAIGTCCKGTLWLRLDVRGRSAHGAYPEQGVNAVDAAYEAYTHMRQYLQRFHHPLLGHATCTVTGISGGVKTNMVADRCAVTLDIRTTPDLAHEALLRRLREICAQCAAASGASIHIETLNDRCPVAVDEQEPFVQMLAEIVRRRTGKNPARKGIKFFSDASIFIKHCASITCIQFGPGRDDCAHIADEYVAVQAYLDSVACYNELLTAYFD